MKGYTSTQLSHIAPHSISAAFFSFRRKYMKLLMNVRSNLSMEYPHACRCVVETLECVCKRLSVAGMFSFCPAVSHFLSELDIVLLKEFLHFLF